MLGRSRQQLAGWGNFSAATAWIARPERMADLAPEEPCSIARGWGRGYGDGAQCSKGTTFLTERLNRLLHFDPQTGVLKAEGGVTLQQVLQTFVPKGWFVPVLPGTKYVTLGGCVAADVHGKNHHVDGSFGQHVQKLSLTLADGGKRTCSPQDEPDLFQATVGGMGLTGFITEVWLKLIPIDSCYMQVTHSAASNLEETLQRLKEGEAHRYSVAWVDCLAKGNALGRGVVMNGSHLKASDLPQEIKDPLHLSHQQRLRVPCFLPSWVLNPYSMRLFNQLYFQMQGAKNCPFISTYDSFFFPLDGIDAWNRIYGKRGFVQYQCVLPEGQDRGLFELFERLSTSGQLPFLAVLKRLGGKGAGLLSFPMKGYTLALDLPIKNQELFAFLNQLDACVLKHGGRIYLAKDARMSAAHLPIMYPKHAEWLKIKRLVDPLNSLCSDLSERLQMAEERFP